MVRTHVYSVCSQEDWACLVLNTLVTHTICSLQHFWLEQTWFGVGNGADKTCDLDTFSLCVINRESKRGGLMSYESFWFIKERHQKFMLPGNMPVSVCDERWRLSLPPLSYSTSKISFKSPHSIDPHSLFWHHDRSQSPLCNYLWHMTFTPGCLHFKAIFSPHIGTFHRCNFHK